MTVNSKGNQHVQEEQHVLYHIQNIERREFSRYDYPCNDRLDNVTWGLTWEECLVWLTTYVRKCTIQYNTMYTCNTYHSVVEVRIPDVSGWTKAGGWQGQVACHGDPKIKPRRAVEHALGTHNGIRKSQWLAMGRYIAHHCTRNGKNSRKT